MSETDRRPGERLESFARAGSQRLDLPGFRKFILRGNVVDLAVGIVIGAAFTAVVNALVAGFLTPLISIPMGSRATEFAARYWKIGGAKFLYGDFLNKLISLVLVGLALYYLVVRPVNRLMERFKPEQDVVAEKKTCPECKSSIPYDATRCAFCTTRVALDPPATVEAFPADPAS